MSERNDGAEGANMQERLDDPNTSISATVAAKIQKQLMQARRMRNRYRQQCAKSALEEVTLTEAAAAEMLRFS